MKKLKLFLTASILAIFLPIGVTNAYSPTIWKLKKGAKIEQLRVEPIHFSNFLKLKNFENSAAPVCDENNLGAIFFNIDLDAVVFCNSTGWQKFGVSGNLNGFAFSETLGWISLAGENHQVSILPDGNLTGYALSETAGWIDFSRVVLN